MEEKFILPFEFTPLYTCYNNTILHGLDGIDEWKRNALFPEKVL